MALSAFQPLLTQLQQKDTAGSPGSSVTLTPASSRDMSAQGTPHQVTPSSHPLPPATPGEDAALQVGTIQTRVTPDQVTPSSHPLPPATPGEDAALQVVLSLLSSSLTRVPVKTGLFNEKHRMKMTAIFVDQYISLTKI